MGRIYDTFGNLNYANEAEVSQKFLLPLLCEYLSYDRNTEVLPERNFAAFDIPQNRKQRISSRELLCRPDFVLVIGTTAAAVVDAKDPAESLDDHLDQLRAYCIGAETNLLLITNGVELRLYDANDLIFLAKSIEELDLCFDTLKTLLAKDNVAAKTLVERVVEAVSSQTGVRSPAEIADEAARRVAVANSDFTSYLTFISAAVSAELMLPAIVADALAGQPLRVASGALLHVARPEGQRREPLSEILAANDRLMIVGESGLGKTTLLREVLEQQAGRCLRLESTTIPVFLRLGDFNGTRTLEEQISDVFLRTGTRIPPERVCTLLHEGRLQLLLDAYDEAFAAQQPYLLRSLRGVVHDYHRCKIVVTTRPLFKPSLGLAEIELTDLAPEDIERFVCEQLDATSALTFLSELRRRRLTREASNTLLLTLMVLLFKRDNTLPRTRRLVLDAVLERVVVRELDKPVRFATALPWTFLERLLSRLAYEAFLRDAGYHLEQTSADAVLVEALVEAERSRHVQSGFSTSHLLEQLYATGLVSTAESGIVFWHRAIMDHFASRETAHRIDVNAIDLSIVAGAPRWYAVLPAAIPHCKDPETAVSRICERNVFMAARCGLEHDGLSSELRQKIVGHLATLCRSDFLQVRADSSSLLRSLDWPEATAELEILIDTATGDQQANAAYEVSLRRPELSSSLATLALSWRQTDGMAVLPPAAAAIAILGEDDTPDAEDRIIEVWAREGDMFVADAAQSALLRLHKRGRLTRRTIDRLVDWALSQDEQHRSRRGSVVRVLGKIGDFPAGERIIQALCERNPVDHRDLEKFLEGVEDSDLQRRMFDAATNSSLSTDQREMFARVLSEIPGIPPEWYRAIYGDRDFRVRAFGLRGLGRCPFAEITDAVEAALIVPPMDMIRQDQGYEFLQACAFEILAAAQKLTRLLEPEKAVTSYFSQGVYRLIDAVSDQRLTEFLPTIREFLTRNRVPRLSVSLCYCIVALGDVDGCMAGLGKLLDEHPNDQFVAHAVVENAHKLPQAEATAIIMRIWNRVTAVEDINAFLHAKCVEAMRRVGAREELKAAAAWSAENGRHHIEGERALRELIGVLQPTDEPWLIKVIEGLRKRGGGFALRRALELAGFIGSNAAFKQLEPFLDDNYDLFRDTAFRACHNIRQRQGVVWHRDLERVGS